MVASRVDVPSTDDLWRLTMEHSPVGMAIVSPAGDILTTNAALCDMLGYEPDALATMSFQDLTHPDDLAADLRLVDQALAGDISSYRVTKRYLCADGGVVIGDLSVALLRTPGGEPVHFISQVADITERQAFVERLDAAEAAADAERRTAHAVFESLTVGILQLGADGSFLAHNARLRDFIGLAFPEGHPGGTGLVGFTYDADQQRLLTVEELPSVRAVTGESFDDVLLWIGEDAGSRRALSVSSRPLHDRVGALTGAVLAYHDVTDSVRATKAKDDFVSTVSHELRTPLTTALAYLELLDESDDVSVEGHQQVAAARRSMLRLSHLVADLLFVTRAASGSQLVDPYRVDVATILAEAVEAASLDAERAGVGLVLHCPRSVVAVADGMRLRQVVDNLLANAVSFSPPGGCVTTTLVEGADTDDAQLVLTVADEGEGIDAADLEHVFERFHRGDNARRLGVPGSGLGLDIVRTIVEAHGGRVTIESSPVAGTSVSVVLPR
ncbi:PAS domain S-box protein [Nocardioides sp. zg-1308]|uniref:Sensor-like histidine kinase SenX3 n=1 Tax=Nocardioides renjunii TaxID=3095075 RepID=A0ABU5K8P0_9ACTN|nr:PAS domain-containing sensor histidine kinase [Nocardioides sp. S-58]MDZ5660834.1 PAS domain S-box protein [Nocardioides sp. S-58]NPD03957.1 PAS domain S-box protein [Nocardioides sp. zg-1308]